MSGSKVEQTLFEVSTGGSLNLSPEQLQQAGLVPGDRVVVSAPAPGHLYLHKIDSLYPATLSHEALSQLMWEAFEQSGYQTREQIVQLVREIRQEMASDQ